MSLPRIKTAIPIRRYQIGEISAVTLSEIDCDDNANYKYIFAFVQENENDPMLYIALIRERGEEIIRVITAEGHKDLTPPESIRDVEQFCEQTLPIAQKLLTLEDEEAIRLM